MDADALVLSPPQLADYLDDFLICRWGRDAVDRPRVDRLVAPWAHDPPAKHLKPLTWVVFADDCQPHAVGMQAIVSLKGALIFLVVYWRAPDNIDSHLWRYDLRTGWQYLAELILPLGEC